MDKSIYKLIFNFYFKIILVYVLVMNLWLCVSFIFIFK
jgi:hypothetical protein